MCIKPLLRPLLFSSSHPHGSQRLFEKDGSNRYVLPGAGNFLISKTHVRQSDVSFSGSEIQNIFEKLVAIVPMLGLALDTDCAHFQKSYSPTLMFLFLEKTVHIFRMFCWRWELCISKIQTPSLPCSIFWPWRLKYVQTSRDHAHTLSGAEQRTYVENMTTTDYMFLFFWAETLKNEFCIADMFFLSLGSVHISKICTTPFICFCLKRALGTLSWSAGLLSSFLIPPTKSPSYLFETPHNTNMSRRYAVSTKPPYIRQDSQNTFTTYQKPK
jgi:hypothetical protein